jgi:hypothetical protein
MVPDLREYRVRAVTVSGFNSGSKVSPTANEKRSGHEVGRTYSAHVLVLDKRSIVECQPKTASHSFAHRR